MNRLKMSIILFVAVITSSRAVAGGTYGNEQQASIKFYDLVGHEKLILVFLELIEWKLKKLFKLSWFL